MQQADSVNTQHLSLLAPHKVDEECRCRFRKSQIEYLGNGITYVLVRCNKVYQLQSPDHAHHVCIYEMCKENVVQFQHFTLCRFSNEQIFHFFEFANS